MTSIKKSFSLRRDNLIAESRHGMPYWQRYILVFPSDRSPIGLNGTKQEGWFLLIRIFNKIDIHPAINEARSKHIKSVLQGININLASPRVNISTWSN